MKRTTLNFAIDVISFIDLLLLAGTGVILRWVLPPGSGGHGFRGGRGTDEVKTLLGLGRHDWGDGHFVLAVLLLVLIGAHVVLHWTWIKTCGKSILFPRRERPCRPDEL